MALRTGDSKNFDTLLEAAADGNLALLECTDNDGNYVAAIVMMNHHPDGDVEMVPVARMFDGNPYEQVNPPILEEN